MMQCQVHIKMIQGARFSTFYRRAFAVARGGRIHLSEKHVQAIHARTCAGSGNKRCSLGAFICMHGNTSALRMTAKFAGL